MNYLWPICGTRWKVRSSPKSLDSSSFVQNFKENSCGDKSANRKPLPYPVKKLWFNVNHPDAHISQFVLSSRSSVLPIRTALKPTASWEILLRETRRYRLVMFTCKSLLWHFVVQMWKVFSFFQRLHFTSSWALWAWVSTRQRSTLTCSSTRKYFWCRCCVSCSFYISMPCTILLCFFSFRTSVQKNIATVKIKAQVVIELPLSVSG